MRTRNGTANTVPRDRGKEDGANGRTEPWFGVICWRLRCETRGGMKVQVLKKVFWNRSSQYYKLKRKRNMAQNAHTAVGRGGK